MTVERSWLERKKAVLNKVYTNMSKLIEEAKDKKFIGMNWQVLDWNEPAINFYKKYNASFDPEWLNCAISFNQK